MLTLTGCSMLGSGTASSVILKKYPQTMNNWSFQYNDETNDYSLFFGFLDKNENPISAEVDVDIRIVSDNNEELYKGTKTVLESDFGNYTSQSRGDNYLANVRIPYNELKKGTALNGTVYFTVYRENEVSFDEASTTASYCLPVKDVQVVCEDLPVSIDVKDYSGKVESTIQINEIKYDYEKKYSLRLTITVLGEKTYGTSGSMYDVVSYKIYDHEGYVVDSGNLFLNSLAQGDKFKEESIYLYDVVPGEKYSIAFSEYK